MTPPAEESTVSKIPIAISSCLLGEQVRYDGGHKHDRYLTGTLGQWFRYVPLCPEVGIGMGTPREPIRLVQIDGAVRVRGVRDAGLDVTDQLVGYADTVADQIADACGYIFKRASPSCGMERVKVYTGQGMPSTAGVGAYAGAVMRRFPRLPVEEEGRLNDPVLRENFIERVFVYDRLRALLADPSPRRLIDFHTRHKLLVMAHNQQGYRRLGRIVADAGAGDLEATVEAYADLLMETLTRRATRRGHTNVLQHLMGYLKRRLDAEDKVELLEVIGQYRAGLVPLVVPMTLLRHHFRRHPHPYVEGQWYLEPHPAELMLRNHV